MCFHPIGVFWGASQVGRGTTCLCSFPASVVPLPSSRCLAEGNRIYNRGDLVCPFSVHNLLGPKSPLPPLPPPVGAPPKLPHTYHPPLPQDYETVPVPHSDEPFVEPLVAALAILPYTGKACVPERYRPLFEPSSPLGDLFPPPYLNKRHAKRVHLRPLPLERIERVIKGMRVKKP